MRRRSTTKYSRRRFLEGVGVSAAVAPFVPLLNREVEAGGLDPVRRLILFYTPDGTIRNSSLPTGSQDSFTLGATMSALAPFQDRLNYLDGVNLSNSGPAGGPHFSGMAGLWSASAINAGNQFQGMSGTFSTGWGSGQTIDQAVVQSFGDLGLPFPSLEFGVQCGQADPRNRMIYAGDSEPLPPDVDPSAAFQRLFGPLLQDPIEFERLRAQRLSTIDIVADELQALAPQYGAADAIKVQRHLDGIRELERRLELESPDCVPPDAPGAIAHTNNANFPAVGQMQMEMLVNALKCDLTRVASMQWSFSTTTTVHSWLGHALAHHGISHSGGGNFNQLYTAIETFYAQQFATFLQLLAETEEPFGQGNMLDNSLVVWGREFGTPQHGFNNVPFVLAGSADGVLETGRFLNCGGVGHERLLVSIGRAMAMDLNSFGGLDTGSGGLPQLGL